MNPTECEEAAALLNFRYVSNDVWKNSPKGCLVHAGFFGIQVYFNSHPIGAPKSDEAPLCAKGTSLRLLENTYVKLNRTDTICRQ